MTSLLWLATAAYGLHVVEEFVLDWRGWARGVLGLAVDWDHFYIVNALVIVLGIVAAEVAEQLPAVALSYPALMLINAVGFHILPILRSRGRFSPGAFTAVVLFLPIGVAVFLAAAAENRLNAARVVEAFVLGAALMASPIVLLKLRERPYFQQAR